MGQRLFFATGSSLRAFDGSYRLLRPYHCRKRKERPDRGSIKPGTMTREALSPTPTDHPRRFTYSTSQDNVPSVLAGIEKTYNVQILLYGISKIIGPREEQSCLMWLVNMCHTTLEGRRAASIQGPAVLRC